MCGDGVCERPFEYAAYGRFGCRADCGRLQDIQNLTAVQIDLQFDFSHPAGSIPATVRLGRADWAMLMMKGALPALLPCLDALSCLPACCSHPGCCWVGVQGLMNQASWNLCPAGDSSGCYWTEDQSFEQLSGSTTIIVPDVPDGEGDHPSLGIAALPCTCGTFTALASTCCSRPCCHAGRWALVLKRDIFSKVSGGVRILPLLEQQALAAKVAAALAAATAQRDSERQALEQVVELGSQGALELVNATLAQAHAAELAAAEEQLQSGALDAGGYLAELAALEQQLEEGLLELQTAEAGCADLPFYQPGMPAGGVWC